MAQLARPKRVRHALVAGVQVKWKFRRRTHGASVRVDKSCEPLHMLQQILNVLRRNGILIALPIAAGVSSILCK